MVEWRGCRVGGKRAYLCASANKLSKCGSSSGAVKWAWTSNILPLASGAKWE